MPEILPHTVQAAVRAVLAHPWGSGPWTAHTEHRFDADCAVCRGDVAAILAVAVAALTAEADPAVDRPDGDTPARGCEPSPAVVTSAPQDIRSATPADGVEARTALRVLYRDAIDRVLEQPNGWAYRGTLPDAVLAVHDDELAGALHRAEQAEAAVARMRGRLDALVADGFGATTPTLRELLAALDVPADEIEEKEDRA